MDNRIDLIREGRLHSIPAQRIDMGLTSSPGGACRYIRRARNGDLFVTGNGIGRTMLYSSDEGYSWKYREMIIGEGLLPQAFEILNDDSILVRCETAQGTWDPVLHLSRSEDRGQTWQTYTADIETALDLRIPSGFGATDDMAQLPDGTLLATISGRFGRDGVHYDDGIELPVQLRGFHGYLARSLDSGKTWGDLSLIASHAAEIGLLVLPAGKLMAASRRQRNNRLPGDPAGVLYVSRQYGWSPICSGGMEEANEDTARFKHTSMSESFDEGYTWVNEQQVSGYECCRGDLALMDDGTTLVMHYDHRYADRYGKAGLRAMVSYDCGKSWEDDVYILSEDECYPDCIATAEGLITPALHEGRLQAVHWRPLASGKSPPRAHGAAFRARDRENRAAAADAVPVTIVCRGCTRKLPAIRSDMIVTPAATTGMRSAPIRYGTLGFGASIQRSSDGDLYCISNMVGPRLLHSDNQGSSWDSNPIAIEGWGCFVGFRILSDGSFFIVWEPVGDAHRNLWAARSEDRGTSWKCWKMGLDMTPFGRASCQDGTLLELADGTLLATVQMWREDLRVDKFLVMDMPLGLREAYAYVLRSTDGGRKWQKYPIDDLVGPARLLLLPDGKILACVYKWGTRNCILTESDDGGVGWSGNRPTSFDPGGPGSLALMADGRLLMQYVYNARPDGHAHMISYYSEGIRVAISKNMGQSWEPQVYILGCWNPDGTGSYLSDSIPLDTDRILSACVLNTDQGMARLQSVTWSPGRESG